MIYLILGATLLVTFLLILNRRVSMELMAGQMLLIIIGDFMVIGQKTYNFLGLFNITLNNSWVIILLVCIILLSMSSAIVLSLFIAGGLLVLLCDDSLVTVIGVESLTLL